MMRMNQIDIFQIRFKTRVIVRTCRSGRPFWLDASGEWLYGVLERRGAWDGERLRGVYILNAVKCVPPSNRPTTTELNRCQDWLAKELAMLARARVVLTLGALAHRSLLRTWEASPLSNLPPASLPSRPCLGSTPASARTARWRRAREG